MPFTVHEILQIQLDIWKDLEVVISSYTEPSEQVHECKVIEISEWPVEHNLV